MLRLLGKKDGMPNFIRALRYISTAAFFGQAGQGDVMPFKRWAKRNRASMRVLAFLSAVSDEYEPRLKKDSKYLRALYRSKGKISPIDTISYFYLIDRTEAEEVAKATAAILEDAELLTDSLIEAIPLTEYELEEPIRLEASRVAELFGGHGIFSREAASIGLGALYVELNPVPVFFVRTYLRGKPKGLEEKAKELIEFLEREVSEYFDDGYATLRARLIKHEACGEKPVPIVVVSKNRYFAIVRHDERRKKKLYHLVEPVELAERPYRRFNVYPNKKYASLPTRYICPTTEKEAKLKNVKDLIEKALEEESISQGRFLGLPRANAAPVAILYRDGKVKGSKESIEKIRKAVQRLEENREKIRELVPYEPLPESILGTKQVSGTKGLKTITELMTPRQLLAYAKIIKRMREQEDGELKDRIAMILAKTLQKNILTRSETDKRGVKEISANQSYYFVLNPLELSIPGDHEGSFRNIFLKNLNKYDKVSISGRGARYTYRVKFDVSEEPRPPRPREIVVLNEAAQRLKEYDLGKFDVIFIDPPYYDMIPYRDLSYLYYARLKKIYGERLPGTKYTLEEARELDLTSSDEKRFISLLIESLKSAEKMLKDEGAIVMQFTASKDRYYEQRKAVIAAIAAAGLSPILSGPVLTEVSQYKPGSSGVKKTTLILIAKRETARKVIGDFIDASLDFEVSDIREAYEEIKILVESFSFAKFISSILEGSVNPSVADIRLSVFTLAAGIASVIRPDRDLEEYLFLLTKYAEKDEEPIEKIILEIATREVLRKTFEKSYNCIKKLDPATSLYFIALSKGLIDKEGYIGVLKELSEHSVDREYLNSLVREASKTKRTESTIEPIELKEILKRLNDVKDDRFRIILQTLKFYKEGEYSLERARNKLKELVYGDDVAECLVSILKEALENYNKRRGIKLEEDEDEIVKELLKLLDF